MKSKEKRKKRHKRHKRVRGKVVGSSERPRLYVFRSHKHIYAQLINDEKNKVLASADDRKLKIKATKAVKVVKEAKETKREKETKEQEKKGKQASAFKVGKLIAQKAKELKIDKVVFDRGGYRYHGRVKSLAEGARKQGLKF